MSNNVILELKDISKTFPGVRALDNVSMTINKGEVHGLIGENGAGKSTLIKILCGVYIADSGKIVINGRDVVIHSPAAAQEHGIQVMHQEINVLPNMTVAENILLADLPHLHRLFIDDRKLNATAKKYLEAVGLKHLDPQQRMGGLSLATQQMVNLARILTSDPKIIVLDEPTASLTLNESQELFDTIKKFKQSGVSIIYISHYLDEVQKITDNITILRDGKYIKTIDSRTSISDDIVTAMIGRKLSISKRDSEKVGEPVLKLEKVSSSRIIKKVSFSLKRQEVLGLYGLNGAGKTEVMRAIAGLDQILEGNVIINDKDVTRLKIDKKIEEGLAYIAEERRRQGLVLMMPVKYNASLGNEKKHASFSLISDKREVEDVKKYVKMMNVVTPSLDTTISSLSGGNQQKVILSRCLSRNSKIILLDEPTVGIDVGAREEIYQLISTIVSQGASVILASSDINEILRMSDRIVVISQGEVKKILHREEATEERLLLHAMGE